MLNFIGINLFPKTNLVYPSSLIRFICSNSTTHHNSFTISYLINNCGLSQQKARSVSKKIHFESSTNPDSVLTLFRNTGFSDSQISKITTKWPSLLLSSVDKTLKPKIDFFVCKGLSGADLVKVLCRDPHILRYSLEKTIIPCYQCLKSIVGTDENVFTVLKRSMQVLTNDHDRIATNIALLHAHGVPDSNIVKLLSSQPRVLLISDSRLSEIVEEVEKLEFNASQYVFLVGVRALAAMSVSSLEAKFNVYRSWGWSEDELQSAFRRSPYCVMLSEKNIMSKMKYFVNKMGYAPSTIAKQPSILQASYEKKIVPRCSVIQVLTTKGLIKEAPALVTFLTLSDDEFLKKFVTKFEKKVPELMKVYRGKTTMKGLDRCSSVI
ncbi:hypothetical protein ACHQM5_019583 [Ranunculus cassubicifolius]